MNVIDKDASPNIVDSMAAKVDDIHPTLEAQVVYLKE